MTRLATIFRKRARDFQQFDARRLGGEDPHGAALLTDADGDPNEGQIRVVDPQAVEEARLVSDPRQDPGLVALQDAAYDALAGAVAHCLEGQRDRVVEGADQGTTGLLIHQADHAIGQPVAVVQQRQNLAQGLAQVQRAAQHCADLVEGAELGLHEVEAAGLRDAG